MSELSELEALKIELKNAEDKINDLYDELDELRHSNNYLISTYNNDINDYETDFVTYRVVSNDITIHGTHVTLELLNVSPGQGALDYLPGRTGSLLSYKV